MVWTNACIQRDEEVRGQTFDWASTTGDSEELGGWADEASSTIIRKNVDAHIKFSGWVEVE